MQLPFQQVVLIMTHANWCFLFFLNRYLYTGLTMVSTGQQAHTQQMRLVGRGCSLLLDTISYFYFFRSMLLCFEFVFRLMYFWDGWQLFLSFFMYRSKKISDNKNRQQRFRGAFADDWIVRNLNVISCFILAETKHILCPISFVL